MAVYKRRYKAYQGELTPAWSRFTVLARYSLGALFTSRLFLGYFVLCFIPLLVGIVWIYLYNSPLAQGILRLQVNDWFAINNLWFAGMLQTQTGLGFILVAWAAPGMITQDFVNQALQLYFSRPLSRTEYILGKFAVLAFLLSCITWIPDLILFGLQAGLAGKGWGWDNFFIAIAIFVSSWLWISVIVLLALALSVFVRWRIAATGLIVGVLIALPFLGGAVNAALQTNLGSLLNISYTIHLAGAGLFHIAPSHVRAVLARDVPLISAWFAILTACALSVLMLNRRLKAREVVRG